MNIIVFDYRALIFLNEISTQKIVSNLCFGPFC